MSEPTPITMRADEIAGLVSGELVGHAARTVTGIHRIEAATSTDVSFISSALYLKFLGVSQAGVILVSRDVWEGASAHSSRSNGMESPTLIIVDDAYREFVKVMQRFFPPLRMTAGLRHSSAVIHPDAIIDETACIGPGCTIDAGCIIGEHVMLYANVNLYENVRVASHSVLHANVVCGSGTQIGSRCVIHPGAVLGADGFGFFENPDGSFEKIPQVGIVVVGNDVEIGANTTIDRAAVGLTEIGNGVKLDNLIHIAHGVSVGENTAMAAQAGISGSTTLGKRNRIAGQVGVVGHITTADDVVVEAQSGLSKSVGVSGHYFGSPAKEHRTALRIEAALRRLPDLLRVMRELQREVTELKDKLHE